MINTSNSIQQTSYQFSTLVRAQNTASNNNKSDSENKTPIAGEEKQFSEIRITPSENIRNKIENELSWIEAKQLVSYVVVIDKYVRMNKHILQTQ